VWVVERREGGFALVVDTRQCAQYVVRQAMGLAPLLSSYQVGGQAGQEREEGEAVGSGGDRDGPHGHRRQQVW
jgi:hypothetical protein